MLYSQRLVLGLCQSHRLRPSARPRSTSAAATCRSELVLTQQQFGIDQPDSIFPLNYSARTDCRKSAKGRLWSPFVSFSCKRWFSMMTRDDTYYNRQNLRDLESNTQARRNLHDFSFSFSLLYRSEIEPSRRNNSNSRSGRSVIRTRHRGHYTEQPNTFSRGYYAILFAVLLAIQHALHVWWFKQAEGDRGPQRTEAKGAADIGQLPVLLPHARTRTREADRLRSAALLGSCQKKFSAPKLLLSLLGSIHPRNGLPILNSSMPTDSVGAILFRPSVYRYYTMPWTRQSPFKFAHCDSARRGWCTKAYADCKDSGSNLSEVKKGGNSGLVFWFLTGRLARVAETRLRAQVPCLVSLPKLFRGRPP